MEKIDILIEELVNEITEQSNNYLPLIINENARVENYFSIIILGLFSKLKNEQIITQYKFQHHINGENRKHIDFFIIQGPNIILLELKHLAIDCEIKKNKRNINFYTSTADQGRKVGIVEDIIKLNKIETKEITHFISLAIITNPPSTNIMEERINFLLDHSSTKDWDIKYIPSNNLNISFLSSIKRT